MMIKGNINPSIKIIPLHYLPMRDYNEDTDEWETINMFSIGDKIYVSHDLFESVKKEFGDKDD